MTEINSMIRHEGSVCVLHQCMNHIMHYLSGFLLLVVYIIKCGYVPVVMFERASD